MSIIDCNGHMSNCVQVNPSPVIAATEPQSHEINSYPKGIAGQARNDEDYLVFSEHPVTSNGNSASFIQAKPDCACGRPHTSELRFMCIKPGASQATPEALRCAGVTHPFMVCDANTHEAAWPVLGPVLAAAGYEYSLFILPGAHIEPEVQNELEARIESEVRIESETRIEPGTRSEPNAHIEPDERTMGALAMAFTHKCDGIIGVGSGVINDCCKVLAQLTNVPYISFATAPSMDGYAAGSSSMLRNGVKETLYNACPVAIIGDIDVIRNAPLRMLYAGLGDMLAKYISVCEWRIAHIITGEYYCEYIAELMREALRKVVRYARLLPERDPVAVQAVMEGLVLSGVAMSYAKISRPASGIEHGFSHVWDMVAFGRGESPDLHGIQVGVGTVLALKLYDYIKQLKPDREKALSFIASFNQEQWESRLVNIFGEAAKPLINAENNVDYKNAPENHAKRLDRICANWPEIMEIIAEELPPPEDVSGLMMELGMPVTPADIGISDADVSDALFASREIRDKYMSCSLLWDLGLLYEDADKLLKKFTKRYNL